MMTTDTKLKHYTLPHKHMKNKKTKWRSIQTSATKPQAILIPCSDSSLLLYPWVITCHMCKQHSLVQCLTERKECTEEPDSIIRRSSFQIRETAVSSQQCCLIPLLPGQIHLPYCVPAKNIACNKLMLSEASRTSRTAYCRSCDNAFSSTWSTRCNVMARL